VADFRDPWTDINYYHELPHTPLARRADAALERLVLTEADAVVSVSPTWCDLLARKGAENVHLVQNGYDASDFPRFAYGPSEDEFVLTYVGSLYASRNPVTLWRTLHRLRAAGRLPKLRIRLVGAVDPVVHQSLRRYGLDAITEHVPYVPHQEAIGYMQQAALLLLVVEPFDKDEGMLTGKVYEYLASGRPVLGLGPPQGDAALLLDATMAGAMVDHDDVPGVAAIVQGHYDSWARGHKPTGAPMYVVREFSRRAQTAVLADVLFSLTDPSSTGVMSYA
jgi:glycosyltransferase involved in cell wall biosynthesis